jgi:hypothetical protein
MARFSEKNFEYEMGVLIFPTILFETSFEKNS